MFAPVVDIRGWDVVLNSVVESGVVVVVVVVVLIQERMSNPSNLIIFTPDFDDMTYRLPASYHVHRIRTSAPITSRRCHQFRPTNLCKE